MTSHPWLAWLFKGLSYGCVALIFYQIFCLGGV